MMSRWDFERRTCDLLHGTIQTLPWTDNCLLGYSTTQCLYRV